MRPFYKPKLCEPSQEEWYKLCASFVGLKPVSQQQKKNSYVTVCFALLQNSILSTFGVASSHLTVETPHHDQQVEAEIIMRNIAYLKHVKQCFTPTDFQYFPVTIRIEKPYEIYSTYISPMITMAYPLERKRKKNKVGVPLYSFII